MACTGTTFITADDAKKLAADLQTIYSEICSIQQLILSAINSHSFDFYITSGTLITEDNSTHDYYRTFVKQITNRQIDYIFEYIISYFTNLRYTIKLQVNPNTQNTLQWYIAF